MLIQTTEEIKHVSVPDIKEKNYKLSGMLLHETKLRVIHIFDLSIFLSPQGVTILHIHILNSIKQK